MPTHEFPLSGEIAIYGKNISISEFRKKPFGVMIESEEMAKSFQVMFDLLWEKIS